MVEQKQIPMAVSRIPGPRPAPTDTMMTPKEVLGILRRHVWLITILTVAGFMMGGVSWYLLRKYAPKYTAETLIRVLSPITRDPMTIGGGEVGKDIQFSARVSIAALIKQQGALQKLIERDKVQQTMWFKRFGEIKDKRMVRAIKELQNNFSATPQKDADSIVVSMTCSDKTEAAIILNEMVDLFLAQQRSTKKDEVAERLARIEEQRLRVQKDMDLAEKSLEDVRARYNISDLEESAFEHTFERKLNDLELEENTYLLQIKQVQANIRTLEKQAMGPINEQIQHAIETDPVMTMLAQQLAIQESYLAGRLTKFGENHKVVREAQELINRTKQEREMRRAQIAEQLRQSNLLNAKDQLVVLQSTLEDLERRREEAAAKKKDLDSARVQYKQRKAIRDERKQMVDSIKEQIEKLRIVREDPETPKVQFVGYAPEPLQMSSPKAKAFFPAGTAMGFMFGIGLAFLIELLNDLVRTPRDVGKYLHIPLLAVIPHADEDEQVEGVDLCHVVRQAPYSIISESYRRFRTNLKLSSSAESLKVLLVSSGLTGEGKTSVAVNLAATFIAEDKKVLLIDVNFRRPTFHAIFPRAQAHDTAAEKSDFELSNLLMGHCGYQDVIRPSGIPGLDVIDTGPLPLNPAELLDGPRMEGLIKQQRENYDHIIIDGPPLLLVSDSKILARFTNGLILVFNAGITRRGTAQRTIRELREINATIVGCVLLGVKAMKGGYFREQFESYRQYQQVLVAHSV